MRGRESSGRPGGPDAPAVMRGRIVPKNREGVDFSAECRLITSIPCVGFGKRNETGLVDATR